MAGVFWFLLAWFMASMLAGFLWALFVPPTSRPEDWRHD